MKKLYADVLGWFAENMPLASSELTFENPYQLIVAVILSAQCTDKRVNLVTPALFGAYPTPFALAQATPEDVLKYVHSVSYPNSKATHLVGMAQKLVADFGGEVPDDLDALQTLPGVGRKTANVVTSIIYNRPVIAVDTHVFRVARRIGLSSGSNVLQVEKDLTRGIPAELRPKAHHWILLHGRYVCTAQKPKCRECGISRHCRYFKALGGETGAGTRSGAK